MEEEKFRLETDIPAEWRADVEGIDVSFHVIPDFPSKSARSEADLATILAEDESFHSISLSKDRNEVLLGAAAKLQEEITECRRTLEHAEAKRREIASNAELIHGECDSQISVEQKLAVFVKSIDSILHYFDDLERVGVDFMSPMFTVLSPDFPVDLAKIEKGIQFFEMNSNYKDAKLYLLKYEGLLMKAIEIVKQHVSNTFAGIVQRLSLSKMGREVDIYSKFKMVAKTTKGLFQLSEKTSAFSEVLGIYTSTRR